MKREFALAALLLTCWAGALGDACSLNPQPYPPSATPQDGMSGSGSGAEVPGGSSGGSGSGSLASADAAAPDATVARADAAPAATEGGADGLPAADRENDVAEAADRFDDADAGLGSTGEGGE